MKVAIGDSNIKFVEYFIYKKYQQRRQKPSLLVLGIYICGVIIFWGDFPVNR